MLNSFVLCCNFCACKCACTVVVRSPGGGGGPSLGDRPLGGGGRPSSLGWGRMGGGVATLGGACCRTTHCIHIIGIHGFHGLWIEHLFANWGLVRNICRRTGKDGEQHGRMWSSDAGMGVFGRRFIWRLGQYVLKLLHGAHVPLRVSTCSAQSICYICLFSTIH